MVWESDAGVFVLGNPAEVAPWVSPWEIRGSESPPPPEIFGFSTKGCYRTRKREARDQDDRDSGLCCLAVCAIACQPHGNRFLTSFRFTTCSACVHAEFPRLVPGMDIFDSIATVSILQRGQFWKTRLQNPTGMLEKLQHMLDNRATTSHFG